MVFDVCFTASALAASLPGPADDSGGGGGGFEAGALAAGAGAAAAAAGGLAGLACGGLTTGFSCSCACLVDSA